MSIHSIAVEHSVPGDVGAGEGLGLGLDVGYFVGEGVGWAVGLGLGLDVGWAVGLYHEQAEYELLSSAVSKEKRASTHHSRTYTPHSGNLSSLPSREQVGS